MTETEKKMVQAKFKTLEEDLMSAMQIAHDLKQNYLASAICSLSTALALASRDTDGYLAMIGEMALTNLNITEKYLGVPLTKPF